MVKQLNICIGPLLRRPRRDLPPTPPLVVGGPGAARIRSPTTPVSRSARADGAAAGRKSGGGSVPAGPARRALLTHEQRPVSRRQAEVDGPACARRRRPAAEGEGRRRRWWATRGSA